MLGDTDELIEILSNTPVVLQTLLTNVDAEQGSRSQGADGWTIVEVVGHLCDAEARAIQRIDQFASHDAPVLDAYDQNDLVERMRYRQRPLQSVLDTFLALREQRLERLAKVPAETWDKPGQHETLGVVTLRQITTHMCNHDVNHIAQIARMVDG